MTAPATYAPCRVDARECPGEAHCLFRAAGNWRHCATVVSDDRHEIAPANQRDATGRQVAA